MPFGLSGPLGTFQTLMNFVVRELEQARVVNLYLDDIILRSKDWVPCCENCNKYYKHRNEWGWF